MRTIKNARSVAAVLMAQASLSKVRRRVEDQARNASTEPQVLRVIGEESRHKGTDTLSALQIDQVIKATRAQKPTRG
jgi:hypothetical protein